MQLNINITLRADGPSLTEGYGNFSFAESFEISATSFLEVCEILGHFQALALKVKTDKEVKRT